MIKRFYVRTSSLREGMKIDQSIKDRMDRTLIARGTYLDSFTIEGLKKRGVTGVYIQEGEEDPEPEKLESLPPVAAKKYRKAPDAGSGEGQAFRKRKKKGIRGNPVSLQQFRFRPIYRYFK